MIELPALCFSFVWENRRRGPYNPIELLPELAALDQNLFNWPWPLSEWEQSLANPANYALGTLSGTSGPCALALFHIPDPQGMVHLLKFMINPEYRGSGIATRFLHLCHAQLIEAGISGMYLEVEETNAPAIGLYKKYGFKILTLKKNFYGTGRNALAMAHLPQGR